MIHDTGLENVYGLLGRLDREHASSEFGVSVDEFLESVHFGCSGLVESENVSIIPAILELGSMFHREVLILFYMSVLEMSHPSFFA